MTGFPYRLDSLSNHFNPHTARAVWQRSTIWSIIICIFQSTYRSRGMTQAWLTDAKPFIISIHIPLARYDMSNSCYWNLANNFNPHTARAVWPMKWRIWWIFTQFQSTYRSRGMTKSSIFESSQIIDFNPHTARAVWRVRFFDPPDHAFKFQSTYRSRGMTADKKLN